MNPYVAAFTKAQPTAGAVHVDRPLTNISIAFMQSETDFVADKVFPSVPVMHRSNSYYIYQREDFLRSQAEIRAPATESAGSGWNHSLGTYYCHRYSVHKDIDDELRANVDPALSNVDGDATEWVTAQLMIRREIVFLSQFFTTGVWDTDVTPGTLWDAAGSTPIADIRAEIIAMKSRTGMKPNTITMSPRVWAVLADHPDVIGRFNQGQTPNGPAIADVAGLGRILEIPNIYVAWGVVNSAVEGATESTDFIAGDHLLLSYSAPSPSLMQPSAGYIFAWTGLLGGNAYGGAIKRMRMEAKNSDRIEGDLAFDAKVVSSELGTLFSPLS